MKVSVEILMHFSCDHCKQWFTSADRKLGIGDKVFCMHCGKENRIDSMQNGDQEPTVGVAFIAADDAIGH